jgi:hypothetical protein
MANPACGIKIFMGSQRGALPIDDEASFGSNLWVVNGNVNAEVRGTALKFGLYDDIPSDRGIDRCFRSVLQWMDWDDRSEAVENILQVWSRRSSIGCSRSLLVPQIQNALPQSLENLSHSP